jgi:hypothetical protein
MARRILLDFLIVGEKLEYATAVHEALLTAIPGHCGPSRCRVMDMRDTWPGTVSDIYCAWHVLSRHRTILFIMVIDAVDGQPLSETASKYAKVFPTVMMIYWRASPTTELAPCQRVICSIGPAPLNVNAAGAIIWERLRRKAVYVNRREDGDDLRHLILSRCPLDVMYVKSYVALITGVPDISVPSPITSRWFDNIWGSWLYSQTVFDFRQREWRYRAALDRKDVVVPGTTHLTRGQLEVRVVAAVARVSPEDMSEVGIAIQWLSNMLHLGRCS